MEDLQKQYAKEPYTKKVILVAALVTFVATFLPWIDVSFGRYYAGSVNAWHGSGFLTVLASAAIICIWLLPIVGVKFKLPAKEDALHKILSVAALAGPVFWIIDSSFSFSFFGFGFYIALASAIVMVYFSFAPKKKTSK